MNSELSLSASERQTLQSPFKFSFETCQFGRHQLIPEHLCCKVLKSVRNTRSSLTSGRFLFSRPFCAQFEGVTQVIVRHFSLLSMFYCCRSNPQLDFKLRGMQRCTAGRHRDVTSAHVTGSVCLGGNKRRHEDDVVAHALVVFDCLLICQLLHYSVQSGTLMCS